MSAREDVGRLLALCRWAHRVLGALERHAVGRGDSYLETNFRALRMALDADSNLRLRGVRDRFIAATGDPAMRAGGEE